MKKLLFFFLFVLSFTGCSRTESNPETPQQPKKVLEIKGADISYLPEIRQYGISLKNASGEQEDMLQTLKKAGVNTIRLRLWKNPQSATSNLASVKALSSEAKALGLKVMITVHYSDSWADPAQQTKPADWQNLTFTQLKSEVYSYTKNLVEQIQPEYIQIGNEINNGFLFPEGNISNQTQFIELLKEGSKGARDAVGNTKIILHYAGFDGANQFFSNLSTVDYDIIGLSYYPMWHGKDLNALQNALNSISSTQNKNIFIAETSYPFTFSWNDQTNNVIGLTDQILPQYPATPAGQKDYLNQIKTITANNPKGIGFCYWGAEWISFKGNTATDGSPWENQAFYDFQNSALPVLEVYKD